MRRWVMHVGNAVSLLGFASFVVSALAMVVLWVLAMNGWLGWIGAAVAVVTAPTGVVFPFVSWVVDGTPSPLYFGVWIIGVVGMALSMTWIWIAEEDDA